MIIRRIYPKVLDALSRQAAVGLIGPRQSGKTTLALAIAEQRPSLYLDLESSEDRVKLSEPALFLRNYEDQLVILDEIHRMPEIFQTLRGLIDDGRRRGIPAGRFLILGSASVELLRQSGESLAGRIEYVDMSPFDVLEVGVDRNSLDRLWLRGGFPESFLAKNESDSFKFRRSFIRTYLERDVAQFGPRIASETLERLWTMLAHNQGTLLNASKLAAGLSLSVPTVTSYIGLLTDLLLVRRLQPLHANVGKRLIKSPKVYVRDSGLVHGLLGLRDYDGLSGHPIVGASWEGFVLENVLVATPETAQASFYRTAAGAEVDLVLDLPIKNGRWAIEIKRSLSPRPEKGFHIGSQDVEADRRFIVYAGEDRYPLTGDIEAIGLKQLVEMLSGIE